MIQMSKCEIKTAGNKRCKNGLVSGKTLEVNGRLVKCCSLHFNTYKGKENVPVWTSTEIIKGMVSQEVQEAEGVDAFGYEVSDCESGESPLNNKEEVMKEDPNTPWNGHCNCGGCTTIGERDACFNAMIADEGVHGLQPSFEEKCIGCEAPADCCKDGVVTSDVRTRDFPYNCVNCKKYHASIGDLRSCLGAAPAPGKKSVGSNPEITTEFFKRENHKQYAIRLRELRGKVTKAGTAKKSNQFFISYKNG
jgi:hypothetical protein